MMHVKSLFKNIAIILLISLLLCNSDLANAHSLNEYHGNILFTSIGSTDSMDDELFAIRGILCEYSFDYNTLMGRDIPLASSLFSIWINNSSENYILFKESDYYGHNINSDEGKWSKYTIRRLGKQDRKIKIRREGCQMLIMPDMLHFLGINNATPSYHSSLDLFDGFDMYYIRSAVRDEQECFELIKMKVDSEGAYEEVLWRFISIDQMNDFYCSVRPNKEGIAWKIRVKGKDGTFHDELYYYENELCMVTEYMEPGYAICWLDDENLLYTIETVNITKIPVASNKLVVILKKWNLENDELEYYFTEDGSILSFMGPVEQIAINSQHKQIAVYCSTYLNNSSFCGDIIIYSMVNGERFDMNLWQNSGNTAYRNKTKSYCLTDNDIKIFEPGKLYELQLVWN